MENVWDLPEVPDEEDTVAIEQYRRAVNILTWYLDKYMVQVAGLEFWGPNIRPYRLMTDKVEVDGDVSGKKKVLVTVTSEAFGLLLFANCREKWIITFQFKEKNGKKAPIPKYNKDDHDGTKQWLAKWSNSRSGSVSGGGWSKEAYKYFEAKKVALTEWRKTEAAGGYVNYQMGQTLVKAANGIAQETDKPASKRRKTDTAKPQDEIEVVDITFLDE